MAWIILIGSGLFEAVWATALARSEGLTRLWPSLVFMACLLVSMSGLAHALRDIPVGTGCAVWTAVGAATTAVRAMAAGAEPVPIVRIVLLVGLVGCVVGLKLTAAH